MLTFFIKTHFPGKVNTSSVYLHKFISMNNTNFV